MSSVIVHTCFSQVLGHPQPLKCACEKYVTDEEARSLVKLGEADWLVVYRPKAKTGYQVMDAIVMESNRRTPRTHTIEKADMERHIDFMWKEKRRKAKQVTPTETKTEQEACMTSWYDVQCGIRETLFYGVILKNGKIVGGEPAWIPDPFEGRAILIMWDDERTSHSRNANIDKTWDDILVMEQNEGLDAALAESGFQVEPRK